MAFVNQSYCLITDSKGNIYNFIWKDNSIDMILHDKGLNDTQTKTIVEDCTVDYDVSIDNKDNIYLICQKNDGTILLLSLIQDNWETSTLADKYEDKILNLNILNTNGIVHIIYCAQSHQNPNAYTISHHFFENSSWSTLEVDTINKMEILNPFQIIISQEKIVLVYYNFVDKSEEIYLRVFDENVSSWSKSIKLTNKSTYKLYLDILIFENKDIHLTYSEFIDGNLVVKYEKHKLQETTTQKLLEEEISNPSNCSYPTLIREGQRIWLIWTEYDNLMSRFSDDFGSTWSEAYLWNESKKNKFFRYKFLSNESSLKRTYFLNYSFGKSYPDIGFIGFGPLEDVVKVPIKAKLTQHKDHSGKSVNRIDSKEEMMSQTKAEETIIQDKTPKIEVKNSFNEENIKIEIKQEIKKTEEYIKRLEERLTRLEQSYNERDKQIDKISRIEEKVDDIEAYLTRRRRGLFGPR